MFFFTLFSLIDYYNILNIVLCAMGFPGGSVVKNPPADARDVGDSDFHSWVGKIPWRGKWQPTPVSLTGKSMDRGAWRATVYGAAKNWTRLSTHTALCNTAVPC